jgi:putative peptidoglycan lipid II flippase
VISTVFASFLVVGSVSWLYYAERLMQFPLGIFGVALATVVLPYLSKEKARADNKIYGQILDWSLKTALIIALPASLALWLLATPMLTALFQYREFTAFDVAQSSKALVMYSIGLVAFILVKIFAAACYARQDM